MRQMPGSPVLLTAAALCLSVGLGTNCGVKWEKGEEDPKHRVPLKDMLARLRRDLEVDETNIL